jgi:hypothetical protein
VKLKEFLRIDGNDWGTLEQVLNYMQELESIGNDVPSIPKNGNGGEVKESSTGDKEGSSSANAVKSSMTPKPNVGCVCGKEDCNFGTDWMKKPDKKGGV